MLALAIFKLVVTHHVFFPVRRLAGRHIDVTQIEARRDDQSEILLPLLRVRHDANGGAQDDMMLTATTCLDDWLMGSVQQQVQVWDRPNGNIGSHGDPR